MIARVNGPKDILAGLIFIAFGVGTFILAHYYTLGTAVDMGPGYFGDVYTFHTYMSNNLEAGSAGKKNGAWQQEATAFVMQSDIKIVEQIDIDAGFFKIVAGYAVYGQKEVKDSFGNELDGK